MPRFYVRSQTGDGDCLAYRLAAEGYDVVLSIEESWCRKNLEGLVKQTQITPHSEDIVLFGTSKSGKEAAALQREGIRVVGGAPIADLLEMQRWQFCQMCTRLGIAIPETERFTDYERARRFLTKDGGRFVMKPSGDAEASCTYVSHDAEDMIRSLHHFETKIPKADFLLQRFQAGTEISLEGWFNGDEWIEGAWNSTMEVKKLMPGDLGPATGCAWSVVYPYAKEPSWAKQLHRRFTEMLHKGRYRGPFDLNCMVTHDEIYVLECTPRFGYDAIQNYADLWKTSFGETMIALASGELGELDVETAMLAVSVRLAIPPYPSSSKEHRAPGDVPVSIDEGDWQPLWPSGIRYDEDAGGYFTAPTDGVIGCLTATDAGLLRAVDTVQATAKRLTIPDLMWRNDIGEGNAEHWQQLATWDFPVPPSAERLVTRGGRRERWQASGLGLPALLRRKG